jgi:hypothetical protein
LLLSSNSFKRDEVRHERSTRQEKEEEEEEEEEEWERTRVK